jgi:ribosomal subunit interface protein
MQITVKGKGMDVGDALRSRITESLNDHLTRYYDRALEAHVTVHKEASVFNVDLALHVPGEVLAAHGDNADPYAAYDAAAHKLFAQVKKHKSRQKDHHSDDGHISGLGGKAVSA